MKIHANMICMCSVALSLEGQQLGSSQHNICFCICISLDPHKYNFVFVWTHANTMFTCSVALSGAGGESGGSWFPAKPQVLTGLSSFARTPGQINQTNHVLPILYCICICDCICICICNYIFRFNLIARYQPN